MKAILTSKNLESKHHNYLKMLMGKEKAEKALVITTAAVPYGFSPRPEWLDESIDAIRPFVGELRETSLEEGEYLPNELQEYDLIFVTGGNSFYLAAKLVQTGLGNIIKDYINTGGLYIGSSAGSIILMKDISQFALVDDLSKVSKVHPALGLLNFAIIPHADNPKYHDSMNQISKEYKSAGLKVFSLNYKQALGINGGNMEII